ncbi:MAG TPA: substrate-binding domain-containing protein [Symbiobacteriaceae bacterium]|nr:substrate-binding domain-containing protein [Symbiobacteriaceae bacterium]
MKRESELRNNLKQVRTRLGLSQQDLADAAGVTRQTIGAVESGLYAPSATVAIRLARVLGCPVESLFWLEDGRPEVEATPAEGFPAGASVRLAMARIGGRWVAHPLAGEQAFRTELIPADGEGRLEPNVGGGSVHAHLLDEPENVAKTVVLAGCTPALSLWARAAERWHPGLRVHWVFANSRAALRHVERGEVHGGGMHLFDPETGEYNLPFVRRWLPGRPVVLVNLGVWEEGLLVRPGNPLAIRTAADLARPGVRIVNREAGAGSRHLLERTLQQEGVDPATVAGFDRVVGDHVAVAAAVAAGQADAGVSAASIAAAFGLGFVPLQQVRYDMVFPKEYLAEAPVQQLIGSLGHRWVRSQLEALGGYDTSRTGEVVAEVGAAGPENTAALPT